MTATCLVVVLLEAALLAPLLSQQFRLNSAAYSNPRAARRLEARRPQGAGPGWAVMAGSSSVSCCEMGEIKHRFRAAQPFRALAMQSQVDCGAD